VGALLCAMIITGVLNGVVRPAAGALLQGPVREAARLTRKLGGPIVVCEVDQPSFSFYRKGATSLRQPDPGDLVFTRVDRLSRLYPKGISIQVL
jgi:hypothetical protein